VCQIIQTRGLQGRDECDTCWLVRPTAPCTRCWERPPPAVLKKRQEREESQFSQLLRRNVHRSSTPTAINENQIRAELKCSENQKRIRSILSVEGGMRVLSEKSLAQMLQAQLGSKGPLPQQIAAAVSTQCSSPVHTHTPGGDHAPKMQVSAPVTEPPPPVPFKCYTQPAAIPAREETYSNCTHTWADAGQWLECSTCGMEPMPPANSLLFNMGDARHLTLYDQCPTKTGTTCLAALDMMSGTITQVSLEDNERMAVCVPACMVSQEHTLLCLFSTYFSLPCTLPGRRAYTGTQRPWTTCLFAAIMNDTHDCRVSHRDGLQQ
jgi:hypothetical protein